MTYTFDCWLKLWTGTWLEKLRAMFVIIMIFALSTLIVKAFLPQNFLDYLSYYSSIPVVFLTGMLSILKVSQ